jgi:hypothetical protein
MISLFFALACSGAPDQPAGPTLTIAHMSRGDGEIEPCG